MLLPRDVKRPSARSLALLKEILDDLSMPQSPLVLLVTSSNPLQQALITETLNESDIPFETRREGPAVALMTGGIGFMGFEQFLVPDDRLREAKDALCAQGIVCDVSERLLRRTLDEVVRPLLEATGPRDLERLAYLSDINNKETVRAIYDAVAKEPGGPQLLVELFFQLAHRPSAALGILAKHHGALLATQEGFGPALLLVV